MTIRGARFDHYHVQEFLDGRIVLEPRELAVPFELSALTMSMMDSSMQNLDEDKVSEPLDLTAFSNE